MVPAPVPLFPAFNRLSQPPPKVIQGKTSWIMHRPPGEVWNSWQSTGADKAIVVCCVWPSKLAVTMAFWLLLTLPATASNVAPLWPAGTVTLGGTESNVLLLAIAEGEHDIDFGPFFLAAWALRVKVWEAPLSVAVSNVV